MSRILAGAGAWLVILSGVAHAQTFRPGAPEQHLPPQITQLTGFGERAVWSPDGTRIAFMSKSFGDAFEIDLNTRLTRLLTGHFRHAGFLRVHYLPNGDYLLIGARDFKDIRTTRDRDEEFWIMKAGAHTAPVALGQKVSEGVAISRTRMRIAWANTHGQYPDSLAEGESVIHMADVVYDSAGTPRLANVRELLRAKRPDCTLEAQDFRRDDTRARLRVLPRARQGRRDGPRHRVGEDHDLPQAARRVQRGGGRVARRRMGARRVEPRPGRRPAGLAAHRSVEAHPRAEQHASSCA